MPHDLKGNLISKGDRVTVEFTVVDVYQTEGDGYCNCSLQTVEPMYPGDSKTSLTVNTKQILLSAEQPV